MITPLLICGFLGAGKTTLLSGLLNSKKLQNKKVALLINDFGALPVDAALIPDGDHYVAKINKGNIFCVCVKTDLLKSFEYIVSKINPDYLLIEATGVAEPSDFCSLLQSDFLKENFGSCSTVSVVDALNFPKLSKILTALSVQVRVADYVIINKIDLVTPAIVSEIRDSVAEVNSTAEIFESVNCKIDFDKIFDKKTNFIEKDSHNLCKAAPEYTETYEFRSNQNISKIEFYEFLNKFRNDILRAKGVVDFNGELLFVEVVNGVVSSRHKNLNLETEGFRSAISFVLLKSKSNEFYEAVAVFTSNF